MGKRFAFFYFMKKEPEKIRAVVPSHIEYWKSCSLQGYEGGPFADRTGGLIAFETENMDEAAKIIMNDPFVLQGLFENKWVKEWVVE